MKAKQAATASPRLKKRGQKPVTPQRVSLSVAEVCERYGVSRRHWLRLVEKGEAPAPVRMGECLRWLISSLEEYELRLLEESKRKRA